ncbi:hypothetical protein C8J57DRAFT_1378478 [Mycena rebaudengoi]|nr:hypothetical protein C8J57DRAFT_1378478 [Mycena rebaudengoi]
MWACARFVILFPTAEQTWISCSPSAHFARSALTNAPRTSRVSFLSGCRTASSQLRSTRTSLRPPTSCYPLRLCVRFRPTDIAPQGSHLAHRRAPRALLLLAAALACLARLSLLRDGIADAGRRYHGCGTGDSCARRRALTPPRAFFLSRGTAASQPRLAPAFVH